MGRRRWDFYEPPPRWYYPPRQSELTLEQAMEAREWWERLEKLLKKDDKKDDKEKKARMFHTIEVFLIMLGCSPLIALAYKVLVIPALLR